jgi:hypothetical protein
MNTLLWVLFVFFALDVILIPIRLAVLDYPRVFDRPRGVDVVLFFANLGMALWVGYFLFR